ncbi:hypothetical protein [Burkholderia ubonensis]|uniref:hypothetical protein n=1 Tax=Burkholderia ubonensis TaxID=101571 RepID=UPI000AEEEFF0|nr:hypothetical protein [Burkholderia ubonensis]
MKKYLGICSLGAGLALPITLWLTIVGLSSQSTHVGLFFVICFLAFSNFFILVLSGISWWRNGASPSFRYVVMVHSLFALLSAIPFIEQISDQLIQSSIDAKIAQVDKAIQADDIRQFKVAREACDNACWGNDALNWELLKAARYDALHVATELIRMSAKVDDKLKDSDLTTCEGLILEEGSALTLAVAHDNAAMVKVLLPASDANNRRQALWTAARLDRLDLVLLLTQAGVPLDMDIYGNIRDGDNSILVAAAQGAAVHVAQWLIETHRMSVNADATMSLGTLDRDRMTPLEGLYTFVMGVGALPRTYQFLDMLVKHGANLQINNGESDLRLTDAVDRELKDDALFFLAVGAKIDPQDTPRQQALDKLLSGKGKPRDRDPIFFMDCIKN